MVILPGPNVISGAGVQEPTFSQFYEHVTSQRILLFRKFLGLTGVLTFLFSGWDYLIDPGHWLGNLPWRVAGACLLLALARSVSPRLSPGRFDLLGIVFAITYSAYLVLVLRRLHQGVTLGMPCLTVFMTLSCFLLVDSRRVPWLLLALLAVARVSWTAGVDPLVLSSHLVVLTMSLVSGGLLARVLEASSRRQFELEWALAREASTDSLTGLLNRRALEVLLQTESERTRRYGRPLSILLIDIDHFKRVNDTWGHDRGDLVLRQLAHTCQRALRTSDSLGRWGGEEFLAVLPETSLEEAGLLAERLRLTVEQSPDRLPHQRAPLTISIGVTTFGEERSWQETLTAADGALYRAKREGRNRCRVG